MGSPLALAAPAEYTNPSKNRWFTGVSPLRYSMDGRYHPVKRERFEYLDCYNNRRIKAKRKGLPSAIYRQQALSAA